MQAEDGACNVLALVFWKPSQIFQYIDLIFLKDSFIKSYRIIICYNIFLCFILQLLPKRFQGSLKIKAVEKD